MSGIYIHIPFCKQACHYCDFHFSTNFRKREEMVVALSSELVMRKAELGEGQIETIYFGGGTPSVLSSDEINLLIDTVYLHYDVSENPEITLEANPDDLSVEKIRELAQSKVNRLSIGIQSFYDDDLEMMNRAHNSEEALQSLAEARRHFENISIDLIYGMPGMDDAKWKSNIDRALSFGVPHISAYALTVEPRTALHKMIAAGTVNAPKDEVAASHFQTLIEVLGQRGFVHYELSNFGLPGFFSRNNSAYWMGKHYLGIGPSAHSFDGKSRSWNVSNNALYLKGMAAQNRTFESELLSESDRYNEYIMTGLRTIWGVSLFKVSCDFGKNFEDHLLRSIQKHLDTGGLELDGDTLKATAEGKFLTDGIASDLFFT